VCRQRVPDDGGCNMEAPLAEPGPGPRNQHVTAFSRTEVCPPRDVSDRHTNVPEIVWAGAVDSQKQLRPPCKKSAGTLAANEAHHEELG